MLHLVRGGDHPRFRLNFQALCDKGYEMPYRRYLPTAEWIHRRNEVLLHRFDQWVKAFIGMFELFIEVFFQALGVPMIIEVV